MFSPEINEHLMREPVLAEIIEQTGPVSIRPGHDPYFTLLKSVVSQQLSTKAADTIYRRFLELFPQTYPQAELLISLDDEALRSVGLSRQKLTYLKAIAAFHLEHGITPEKLEPLTDEEVIRYLIQIKGVGKWTVEMLLIFNLNRPDILPVDDLIIRNNILAAFGISETGKQQMAAIYAATEPWRPYRSYACRYLWRWSDSRKEVK